MRKQRRVLTFGGQLIPFVLVRRDRKTMEIAVEPDGSVVVVAPKRVLVAVIEAKLRKRAAWVRKQQATFARYRPGTPARRFLSGESHRYLGRRYRLKVRRDESPGVTLLRGVLVVQSPDPACPERTRQLLEGWYRQRARDKFAERLEMNLQRFALPDAFRPVGLVIRKLKCRWGSMSPGRRLVINARLIEAPVESIDYVITHELCHIAEANHGRRFTDLLDRVLPDWRQRKDRLERAMA